MGFETFSEGTKTADGTEQVLCEISEPCRLSGYISLAQMGLGDIVILRQYARIDGAFERYAQESYSGVQAHPIIYVTPKEITSTIRVTIQQTAGAFKGFNYLFIKEVPAVIPAKAKFQV